MSDIDTTDVNATGDSPVLQPVGPLEVSEELRPRIDELGLWDAIEHFREHGYAVIRNVAPPELMDDLRAAIHSRVQFTEPTPGFAAPHLLGQEAAVDRVATLPKILAFAEFSVGKGMLGGRFVGSIKRHDEDNQASRPLPLHADQSWIPAPFPDHNLLVTFCFACEGMTEAGGATCVVPGSHRLRRPITEEESASAKPVPIETEKGDVAVWDGSIWHGSLARTIPGTRTVLHATYQRFYTQAIDDFSYLLDDEEYMANAPEGIRDLLGGDLPFGTSTRTRDTDMVKFARAVEMSKL